MQVIPLAAVPSQTVAVVLNGQQCSLSVYEKDVLQASGDVDAALIYLDLYVSQALICGGVLCRNGSLIVREAYRGFVGDLAFYDAQGITDPVSSGFGAGGRYFLAYLAPSDL